MVTALKVKAKRNGFRRAGRKFSDTTDTIIPVAELTKEQLAAIQNDPNLLVAEIEIKEEKSSSKPAGAGDAGSDGSSGQGADNAVGGAGDAGSDGSDSQGGADAGGKAAGKPGGKKK